MKNIFYSSILALALTTTVTAQTSPTPQPKINKFPLATKIRIRIHAEINKAKKAESFKTLTISQYQNIRAQADGIGKQLLQDIVQDRNADHTNNDITNDQFAQLNSSLDGIDSQISNPSTIPGN